MPKPSKEPEIKAGASNTEDARCTNDHVSVEKNCETNDEPPTKRVKGDDATTESTPEPVWDVIEKPPFHTEWSDIPNWKQREDCPLMDRLPVEVLDKIFCVRPELQVRPPFTARNS